LQNLVERGVISAEDGAAIDVAHMFRREQLSDEALLAIGAHGTLTASRSVQTAPLLDLLRKELGEGGDSLSLAGLERRLLEEAVAATNGNLAAAARQLGLTRAQLAYRLQRSEGPPASGG